MAKIQGSLEGMDLEVTSGGGEKEAKWMRKVR